MPIFNFLKDKLSILDVICEYVQLKQAGGYWKGPCPFHQEKEASFTVSPDKQIFYCFGCHAGGDLIAFIAKSENLSQFEAAKFLIDKYQIQVPEHFLKKIDNHIKEKNNYFDICKVVSIWMSKQLQNNQEVQQYLKKRFIELQQIKYFNIGYFPGGINFINRFIKEMAYSGILVKDLIDVGILMEGKSILYSPFEERIIFPIKDFIGRYCGFGGRIFKQLDQRAKYYNSKESDWFSKGKLLFGFD